MPLGEALQDTVITVFCFMLPSTKTMYMRTEKGSVKYVTEASRCFQFVVA